MGYFNAGFAFHQEPDWAALPATSLRLLGYAHKSEKLYLLACQERHRTEDEYPFTEFARDESYVPVHNGLDPALVETLANASNAVSGGYYDLLVRNALLLGQDLAARLKSPLVFFAVNDDMLNLSFTQDAEGKLTGFLFQSDGLVELKADGRVQVCPIYSEEDEEECGPNPSDLQGVEWGPANSDPLCFCSAPLKLWPASWPNPEKGFGLGTWDIFENFAKDFVKKT